VPNASKLSGLALLFALGTLAAWTLGAAGRGVETTTEATTAAVETTTAAADTTTESTPTTEATETTSEVVTEPSSIVTTTVQITTTRLVPLPTGTTTSSGSEDGTEDWVWVLIAILAAGLIALIGLLARRGRGGGAMPAEERRRHLDAAVASWTGQGWAIESETADTVVLRRDAEAMLVSVDRAGHVSTSPLRPG
jgi:hypothetical protein